MEYGIFISKVDISSNLKNNDIDIDIDKAILKNIDIDKKIVSKRQRKNNVFYTLDCTIAEREGRSQQARRAATKKSGRLDGVRINPSLRMMFHSWRENKLESVIWACGECEALFR